MIQTVSNWVLIKPDFTDKEIISGLHVETSYNQETYAPTKGVVLSAPKGLVHSFMEWTTVQGLNVGDTVFFHYLATLNGVGAENRTIEVDGELCFFVKYDSIFAKKCFKTGAIETLNGYLLLEPIKKEDGVFYDSEIQSFHEHLARVKYLGAINTAYRYHRYKDSALINTGDVVVLDKACNTFVANPIYYGDTEQSFFRAQRTNVLAILTE
jgi:hypothetical protein